MLTFARADADRWSSRSTNGRGGAALLAKPMDMAKAGDQGSRPASGRSRSTSMELSCAMVNIALNARDAMPQGGDGHDRRRKRASEPGGRQARKRRFRALTI